MEARLEKVAAHARFEGRDVVAGAAADGRDAYAGVLFHHGQVEKQERRGKGEQFAQAVLRTRHLGQRWWLAVGSLRCRTANVDAACMIARVHRSVDWLDEAVDKERLEGLGEGVVV